ncbi:hypothetical protein OAJ14_05600 [Polaribacter sp.]|nr:hypothetical protein [Polaribacter sp.]
MPFNSESASLGGQKSRRGKSLATEIRNQITEVAEELIKAIEIASLSNKDKVLYLKAIMPFILSKNERVDANHMPTEFQIEIIK